MVCTKADTDFTREFLIALGIDLDDLALCLLEFRPEELVTVYTSHFCNCERYEEKFKSRSQEYICSEASARERKR